MAKIVECVPNISDGKNPDVYNTVAKSCEKVSGVQLLDVDPGAATNRTVITFAGPPEVIVDAAFEVVKCAKELIDMQDHHGEHARMGATDVCPFVPVSGVTLEECAELAKQLGKRVGEELGVWVYLYEAAASKPEWENLANVRKGEYESLPDRVGKPEWKPDFGPEELDPKFGAMATGARKFLIAYNININSRNVKMAKDIAFNIRESGRAKRKSYPDGEIIRHPDGKAVKIPGIFQHCKSTGWLIPEYNCAQLTMNLTDIDVTPVHVVFDEVLKQANERGIRVTGSEIVGLVPLQTMLEAGLYYAKKQGLSTALSKAEIVNIAIRSLGLTDVAPFNPEEKIIEYRFRKKGELISMSCEEFIETLASDAPAPGGGSVAALCGAMAASLGAMVSNLTHGKIEYKEQWNEMEEVGVQGQKLKAWYLDAVDRDTDAFNAVMDAMRLPKATEEQQKARDKAMLEANKHCTMVPLEVLENTVKIIPILEAVAEKGNPNCASDAGVGAHCMVTCAEGAALNVRINLAGIDDEEFNKSCRARMDEALTKVRSKCKEMLDKVDKNLEK
jgi:glutamate formiminotransferase/formiminotetrahydrofolate cyclodeaminase